MDVSNRVEIVPLEDGPGFWEDGETLRRCLAEVPPRIPPHFGYDELGSQLFEEITDLPDYYLTRVEYDLLARHASDIAERLDSAWIAELGSGSAKKSRLLLTACVALRRTTYLPIDVSRDMLVTSAGMLTDELADLQVRCLWGRYEAGLDALATRPVEGGGLTVAMLGSNFGNATVAERIALLARLAGVLRPGDRLLVSADLVKPAEQLTACYNDPPERATFTRFRLNHLTHLNRRFDGDFDVQRFRAHAHYDEPSATVMGHVCATADQHVELRKLGVRLHLPRGSSINVGYSAKFERDSFITDVTGLGFDLDAHWIDETWQYGVFLLARQ